MKKAMALVLAALLTGAAALTAAAAGGNALSDWKNLPGYTYYMFEKDGKRHPVQLSQTKQGINLKCDGFYEVNTKEYSGIVLTEAVAVDGFTMEFTVNTPGGNSDDGDDCWLGIGLMDQPNIWDVYNPKQAAGFVNLIRPNTKDCGIQLYEYTHDAKNFNSTVKYSLDDKSVSPKGKTKVQIKQNADKSYSYYINGTKVNSPLRKLNALYEKTGGKAYLYFGTSTNSGNTWDVTINSINGKSLGSGGTAAVSSQAVPSASKPSQSGSNTAASSRPEGNVSTPSTPSAASAADVPDASDATSAGTLPESSIDTSADSAPGYEDSSASDSTAAGTESRLSSGAQPDGKKQNSAFIWITAAVAVVLVGGGAALLFVKLKKR